MPTKSATSIAKKRRKSARVRRKRDKLPSATIVALNLSKCVSRNLTDLVAKLEISKKHLRKKALSTQGQEFAQTSVSQEEEKARKKISKMTRKKFNFLGKRFIKEFKHFSKYNENYSSRNRISYPQTLSWLKKAELLDNHRVTIRDVEVHYINKLKTGYELKVLEFIRFLKSLCEDRGLEMPTVIFKLLRCRKQAKFIKKKKMTRYSKNFKRKQETPRALEKKVSPINTLVRKSKETALDNAEEFEVISEATHAVVPKTEDSSVLGSDYARNKNNSGDKTNKITYDDQNVLCDSLNIDQFKESYEIVSRATSTLVPKMEESSFLSSAYVRKTDGSGEKTIKVTYDDEYLLCDSMNVLRLNNNKGWTDSDVNSDPLCYLPEFSEDQSEENFTDPLKDKTIVQNEYLKPINDWDLENIVSIEAIPSFYFGKYPVPTKHAVEWVTPALTSVPPQISANAGIDNDSTKIEICAPKKFQNSASQNYKSSNVKKTKLETKLNRHKVPVAVKLGVVKAVNKQGQPKNAATEDAGKIFEAQNEEESFEYIDSDEADDRPKYKLHPVNTYCSVLEYSKSEYKNNNTNKSETLNGIRKVGIKTGEVAKSRNQSLDKETSEIVSIQHFDRKKNGDDGVKKNKRSFEIMHKINKTLKKRSRFHTPSKNSSSSKIRNYLDRIFNGNLSGEMEENNIKEIKTESKEMSPNRKTTSSTPRLQSELQESNTSLIKNALGDMKDQKNFSPNIKNTDKNKTEKSPINAGLIIPSPERKRKPIKNNRTFTNLPVKQVKKSLQKSRKEKILKLLNNENAPPVSKSNGPTNGRKITSSKGHILPTKCDTVKSKLIDGARNERGSEIQNSNIDADFTVDISKSETDKHGMAKKKGAKRHKIRKGVRLRKKEFKDPVTEIQDQKLTES